MELAMTGGVGCVFPAVGRCAPLGLSATESGTIGKSPGNKSNISYPMGHIWSDARTQGNVMKTTRVLKVYVLKQTSSATMRLLGAGSKIMSMVFTLRRFPSNLKALQVPLPASPTHMAEGLFVKTAKGKKVLSVQFGSGDMEEDALVKNAAAVLSCVHGSLDARLVRDITVNVDKLSLPVWSRKLWDRGKQKVSAWSLHASRRNDSKRGAMDPPIGLPLKRARMK